MRNLLPMGREEGAKADDSSSTASWVKQGGIGARGRSALLFIDEDCDLIPCERSEGERDCSIFGHPLSALPFLELPADLAALEAV